MRNKGKMGGSSALPLLAQLDVNARGIDLKKQTNTRHKEKIKC